MRGTVLCLLVFLWGAGPSWGDGSWTSVEKALGQPGEEEEQGGILFRFPRTDLNILVHGIALEPGMGLTSWAAFKPLAAGTGPRLKTLLTGKLVLLDEEVPAVTASLAGSGITLVSMESPFLDVSPSVRCLYIEGKGPRARLAASLEGAFKVIAPGTREAPSMTPTPFLTPVATVPPTATPVSNDKVWAKVEKILGEGRSEGRVLWYEVPFSQPVTLEGEALPPYLGAATHLYLQKVEGLAVGRPWPLGWGIGGGVSKEVVAATGEFALSPDQAQAVGDLLTRKGILITALEEPFPGVTPPMAYLHFWALGAPGDVAGGLKAALDE